VETTSFFEMNDTMRSQIEYGDPTNIDKNIENVLFLTEDE